MQSLNGNQLGCRGQSLWNLVAEHVPGSELPKIQAALGHSLVDMYKEVYTEMEMWHKMWQESQPGNNRSRTGTPLSHQLASPLADPPAVKELVRAEVKMLLQTLNERASRQGRDGKELLFGYKPETVDYALSHLDSCYRHCTNPENTDNISRPRSHCLVQSNAEDEIEAMKDKLNVIDIDQVVDRLRAVLMEECKALNRLVKHFKENIKHTCRNQWEFDQSEPTLADLKELRGAIQMDLDLYPSSLAALPSVSSPLPSKKFKNRLSAGQRASDETLRSLSAPSALRPHPPPPLCHTKPRPPLGAPPNKSSSTVKLVKSSSLSRTHGEHRSTLASTGARKTQTPNCSRIVPSGHANRHFTTLPPEPGSDQMLVKITHRGNLSSEQDSGGLHSMTLTSSPSFQIKTPKNSCTHETHLSSHRSVHSLSTKCDLSPQMTRNGSPAFRSRNINTTPSIPNSDAGSYSSNADHLLSSTGKSKTQNEQQNSTCGGRLVSTAVQTYNDRRKSTSERFQSEAGSSSAHTGSRNSNNGMDRNTNGHLGKDVVQQQSLVATCTHPVSKRINGQFFTPHKRPLEGTTSQQV
ncbi:coiled-coil domain-containing protein 24 [Etheostoma spectabile]|uniref:coiled-coil domain-containing protein 24 n=1 Tax=Etheostoma spectabile TaxID=54343 RepID=UPI0013AFC547|nr:coiled-coil domain-containing protein 24 [Etheostoma spectabile]